jgi:TP901 family phage tail tape measure protein
MADFSILVAAKASLKQAQSQLSAFGTNASKTISKFVGGLNAAAGTAAMATLAGLALAMAGGAAAAVKFENEFANVKKTMNDVQDPQVFKNISDDILRLATEIPIMAGELAGIAAVGGQLGIGADDISSFTEVVAKLGTATNMSAEQAATSMARFLNVTNEQTDAIGKYAAVLVELGNSTAATEGEIILLAQNFGATGNLVGLSTEEILAFSAAMRETGQQSQAGATALGKLFLNLSDAAKLGGKEMSVFAETAGMDINEFRRLIETDIGEAAQIFLGGLNSMNEEGRSTTATLEDLGLGTIRVQRALLSLANNEEGLTEARKRANEQAITQNALNDEAAQKFETASMKITQIKSALNAAAITFGEIFLPALKIVLDAVIGFVAILQAMAEMFREMPILLAGTVGVLGLLSALFAKSAVAASGFAAVFGKIMMVALKFTGVAGLVIGALALIGKAVKSYRDDIKDAEEVSGAVDEIINSLKVDLTKGFQAEPITKDQWTDFLANLPEATKEAVEQGVKKGMLGEDVFNAIVSSADGLPKAFNTLFADVVDLDEGFFAREDLDIGEVTKMIGMIKDAGLEQQLAPVLETLEQYKSALGSSTKKSKEQRAELMEILKVQFSIFQGVENEKAARDEMISGALNEHFKHTARIDRKTLSLLKTEEGRLELARKLASGPNGIQKFKDILGDVVEVAEDLNEEFEGTETNLDALLRISNDFRTKIDKLFNPIKEQFELQKNERDLAKAHKEHADLHKEQKKLTADDLTLQQELQDLATANLETEEEKLEIQELNNEALEIEQKIREGNALSANDFLKKEKLKKELAQVNAAISQGSLEFPEKERQFIQDQIDAIDDKALTQKDADEKRKKASEIAQSAEERRLEAIEEIELRRIEIGERLAEIPNEILDTHQDIHELQRDLVGNQLDMIQAQADYNTLKEDELRMTAELLGMNMSQIDGLMTLMNHVRVESGPMGQSYLDKLLANVPELMKLLGYDTGNSTTGTQAQNLVDTWKKYGQNYAGMNPTFRHMGGNFKPGQNYVVGEYGPEMMKAFPGGGGQITPMGSSRGDTVNNVTLNVTGLPSDPISARRTAQLIQKELNKLKGDGRSGVVR